MRQRLLNSNFVSSADLNTLYTTPIPYITEIPSPPGDFVPVDVFLDRKGYKVVGKIPNRPETNTEISIISFHPAMQISHMIGLGDIQIKNHGIRFKIWYYNNSQETKFTMCGAIEWPITNG